MRGEITLDTIIEKKFMDTRADNGHNITPRALFAPALIEKLNNHLI